MDCEFFGCFCGYFGVVCCRTTVGWFLWIALLDCFWLDCCIDLLFALFAIWFVYLWVCGLCWVVYFLACLCLIGWWFDCCCRFSFFGLVWTAYLVDFFELLLGCVLLIFGFVFACFLGGGWIFMCGFGDLVMILFLLFCCIWFVGLVCCYSIIWFGGALVYLIWILYYLWLLRFCLWLLFWLFWLLLCCFVFVCICCNCYFADFAVISGCM